MVGLAPEPLIAKHLKSMNPNLQYNGLLMELVTDFVTQA